MRDLLRSKLIWGVLGGAALGYKYGVEVVSGMRDGYPQAEIHRYTLWGIGLGLVFGVLLGIFWRSR